MIVRRTIPLRWFIQIDGWNVLVFTLYVTAVCILNLEFFFEKLAFPFTGISVFGTAVAILLGFRNNSAYERFWEARTAWGDVTNSSRNFASQVISYIYPRTVVDVQSEKVRRIHRELVYRHLAFLYALKLQLRNQEDWEDLSSFLSDDERKKLDGLVSKAVHVNHWQAQRLGELAEAGWVESRAYVMGTHALD